MKPSFTGSTTTLVFIDIGEVRSELERASLTVEEKYTETHESTQTGALGGDGAEGIRIRITATRAAAAAFVAERILHKDTKWVPCAQFEDALPTDVGTLTVEVLPQQLTQMREMVAEKRLGGIAWMEETAILSSASADRMGVIAQKWGSLNRRTLLTAALKLAHHLQHEGGTMAEAYVSMSDIRLRATKRAELLQILQQAKELSTSTTPFQGQVAWTATDVKKNPWDGQHEGTKAAATTAPQSMVDSLGEGEEIMVLGARTTRTETVFRRAAALLEVDFLSCDGKTAFCKAKTAAEKKRFINEDGVITFKLMTLREVQEEEEDNNDDNDEEEKGDNGAEIEGDADTVL